MNVNRERLREDIEANAEFGRVETEEGRSRTVLTGTEANREAREYLVERLEDAGLEVRVDAVGNIAGRWTPETVESDGDADSAPAPVAAGSHLDSVPEGGIFDGPLGVYSALEAVRAMQDAGVEPERPIEVVSFTEEEGQRFASGLLGSSVAVGERSVEEALNLEAERVEGDAAGGSGDGDENGDGSGDDSTVTLEAALEAIGFRGDGLLDASEWDAWLELHVEQSERLEDAGVPVGVVTAITGITHCEATVRGEADHAGATPMGERCDALAAASEVVLDVESAANDVVADESETAVGTVGSLNVRPNATNVVPGEVEMGVDIRDVERDAMEEIVSRAQASLDRVERKREVETDFARPFDLAPTPMSDRVREVAHSAGEQAEIETLDLHSGAAHDTMHVAEVTDSGLLFAPSRDGISHNPKEWTDWDDCATATRLLAGALAELAGE